VKATGIVRRVDELGRIVIPKELRSTMGLNERDPLEIFVADGQVILKKYQPACIFCGNAESLLQQKGHNVCKRCMHEMAKKTARQ